VKISIFGLGYVGSVSAACLSRDGHDVIGVDPATAKLDAINAGNTPIMERGLGDLISAGVEAGRLRATGDHDLALRESDVSLVCVGTPSLLNGNLDLRYVRKVCEQIGTVIGNKDSRHTVVIRSTMLPGSMQNVVIPALEEASGKQAGEGFGVCINPEFLREGSAVDDYDNPPKTVVGASDQASADLVMQMYAHLPGPKFATDLGTAEMVKYTDNAWHAVKIAFANEIGNIAKQAGIDSHRSMEIFCSDTKLNISTAYLKPGFAFGGSCLPKDLRALTYRARSWDIETPLLSSVLPSNAVQVETGLEMVKSFGKRRIGILGFSFKEDTDDLRESPMVELIEQLLGKGYELALYDTNVKLAALSGANRDFILNQIPHISRLMQESAEDVVRESELLVLGTRDKAFITAVQTKAPDVPLIDFVRLSPEVEALPNYHGICWGETSNGKAAAKP
jgi:GDP-mannose 6-dehydrogenase